MGNAGVSDVIREDSLDVVYLRLFVNLHDNVDGMTKKITSDSCFEINVGMICP